MQLQVVSVAAPALRVALAGRVGTETDGRRLSGDPLQSLLGPDVYTQPLLLSLERADFCDSLGVAWLLSCHRRFKDAGGKLVLHSVPPLVMSTLRLLHLDRVFHLAADEPAAVAQAGSGTAA
jgi:anti-anti-sigma factor